MNQLGFARLAAALCLLLVTSALVTGCASKTEAPAAAGAPSAADAKMGSDYGKGVAAMHSQQQTGGTSPAPSHP